MAGNNGRTENLKDIAVTFVVGFKQCDNGDVEVAHCFASSHAKAIQESPQLLAGAALNVTLSSAKSTSNMMVLLSRSQGINPSEVAAMTDCIEELSDSVDELGKSIKEMGQLKGTTFNLVINDIQTWVSAALTDESTCTDGFARKSMNGNLKITVKDRIVNVAQLTSNALATNLP
ncbi:hypothetical protein FEM48_Zijuj03G0140200 [Ziziphus jujuba var. spinosa]|uniref:Pectinesterase inhibitor domain-containing protein n=1 Tax=Ziziphus jujuba var. spinosa TaxID=714518 RepID=A0A978VQQ7_ZIZJJ|nr:hypothetical protein FEM48_Zijuj03G0140200 [Ziziphus jujuba var. spinosa]